MKQASHQLGIGRRAVLKRIHAGRLPAVRDESGAWRIPEETLT